MSSWGAVMNLDQIATEMTSYMRLMAETDLCHLRGGNLAVRTGDDEFVVTRTKTAKENLTRDNLMVLAISSDEPEPEASVSTSLHRLIFRKTDATAVIHAHPYNATLLSFFTEQIRPIDENGVLYLGQEVEVVAPPGFKEWSAVDEKISDALTRAPAAVLRWHGCYAIGDSFGRAFQKVQALDWASRFILDTERLKGGLGDPTYPAYVDPTQFAPEVNRS